MVTYRSFISWLCMVTMLSASVVTPAAVWCMTADHTELALGDGKSCSHLHGQPAVRDARSPAPELASLESAQRNAADGPRYFASASIVPAAPHGTVLGSCDECVDMPVSQHGVFGSAGPELPGIIFSARVLIPAFGLPSVPPVPAATQVTATSDRLRLRRSVLLLI